MDRKKAINIAIESVMIRDMTPNIKIEIITALKGMEMEEDIRVLSKKIINKSYGISYIDTDSVSNDRKI